ncbi:MAG TPA: HD domain-containing protein [Candidatus Dojkabacteria bacterium]|nr:HD domain-containing protein [Candidatus Dojkabacteria bacterium]HQF36067.1 HD domain-containing protein [Candidatus Dojkabacteria bacterium]
MSKYDGLVTLFYEIGSLRKLQRAYNLHMLQDVESVAEHSQRVTMIAFFLANEVGVDVYKTILMAMFHDLVEARTGDLNWHQKSYAKVDEEKAMKSQLKLMGQSSKFVRQTLDEYHERKSLESKVAKDADCLDYFLSLQELALQGNQEALRRIKEDSEKDILHTDVAKELFDLIMKIKPNVWYQQDRKITHKKYKVK